MEAANKGAFEAGGRSVGLTIDLPQEQPRNAYTNLTLKFHYFFVRKVMLVKYASAFVLMPGGWGTFDELFETLNLIQTEKVHPLPTVLVGRDYWSGLVEWMRSYPATRGYVSKMDLEQIQIADDVDEVLGLVGKAARIGVNGAARKESKKGNSSLNHPL